LPFVHLQKGYKLNGIVLRAAEVGVVRQWPAQQVDAAPWHGGGWRPTSHSSQRGVARGTCNKLAVGGICYGYQQSR